MSREKTKYPSVTQVVTMHIDKQWFKPEYAHRGTMVHQACNAHINGVWVMPMEASHTPYYTSFKQWADKSDLNPVKTEVYLEDAELGFCGHPDFIGTMEGKEGIGVLDWKTSKQASPWWRLQIAAYRKLFDITYGAEYGETSWGADVILAADGESAIFHDLPRPRKKTTFVEDIDTFVSLLIIYKHLNSLPYNKAYKPIINSFNNAVKEENTKNSIEPSEDIVVRKIVSQGLDSILK